MAVARLERAGILLPSSVVRLALSDSNRASLALSVNPVAGVVHWLAHRDRLESLNQTSLEVKGQIPRILEALAKQQAYGLTPELNDAATLVARRYLLGLAESESLGLEGETISERFERYLSSQILIDSFSNFSPIHYGAPENEETIYRWFRQTLRLLQGVSLGNTFQTIPCPTDEASDALDEAFDQVNTPKNRPLYQNIVRASDAMATASLGCASILEVPSLLMFGQFEALQQEPPIFALIFLLQLMYGLRLEATLSLGLSELSPVGQLSRDGLHLVIGSPYYSQALGAYAPSVLRLPVCAEVRSILDRLGPEIEKTETLSMLLGDRAVASFKEWSEKKLTSLKMPKPILKSVLYDRVWQKIAVLDLGILPTLVGLLRGSPLQQTRGAAAYISADDHELSELCLRIHAAIRDLAGRTPEPGPVSMPHQKVNFHGTPAPALRDYLASLRDLAEKTDDLNMILACVEGLIRCLGRRNLGDPVNPIWHFTSHPIPCLELEDKLVQGYSRVRWVPVSASIISLLDKLTEFFPKYELLPFIEAGNLFPLSEHSEHQQYRRIFSSPHCRQVGRTMMYNALRKRTGQYVLDLMMGHGPELFSPMGSLDLVPLRQGLKLARGIMLEMYREEGYDDLARLLAFKIKELFDPKIYCSHPGLKFRESRSERRIGESTDSATAGLRPLSQAQKYFLYSGGEYKKRSGDLRITRDVPECLSGLALNPNSIAVMLIQQGLPAQNLLRLGHYYTSRNLVVEQESNEGYFLALCEHADVGGLSLLPIPIGQVDQNNRLCALWKMLFASKPNHRLFPSGFTRESLGDLARRHFQTLELSTALGYKFLSKVGQDFCRLRFPSPFLYALALGKRYGLNYASIEDTFEIKLGRKPHLVHFIDGEDFQESADALTQVDDDQTRNALSWCKQEKSKYHNGRILMDDLKSYLKRQKFDFSPTRLVNVLKAAGYPESQIRGRLSNLSKWYREQNLLRVSKPFRLLAKDEMLSTIGEVIQATKAPKKYGYGEILATGLRCSEPLPQNGFRRFVVNGKIHRYVERGKSKNARRFSTYLTNFSEMTALVDHLATDPQGHQLRASGNAVSHGLNLKLSDVAQKQVSAHDFRHSYFFHQIQNILTQFVSKLNLVHPLCRLALEGGHRSCGTTIFAYAGTGLIALSTFEGGLATPQTDPIAALLDRRIQVLRFPNRRAALEILESELNGSSYYQVRMDAAISTLTRLIQLKSAGDSDPVHFGKKPTLELVSVSFNQSFGVPGAIDVLLPSPSPITLPIWEEGALEIASRFLKKHLNARLHGTIFRPTFLQKLRLLTKSFGVRLTLDKVLQKR